MYLKRVYDLREDSDLTQKKIAEYLGIHPNVYRRYEKGVREFPLELIVKLADYYHVSTDYLLGRTDRPEPYPAK
ncbi:MAG: XRE family transcriptional regulator [Clostridiales bacterium]|nr:XRE family transcriptional regulator [Clostridiales bacterium]